MPADDPERADIHDAVNSLKELTDFIKEEQQQFYATKKDPKIFLSGFSQGSCIASFATIVSLFDLVQKDDDFLGLKLKGISCPPLAGVNLIGSVILPQVFTRLQEIRPNLVSQASQTTL